MSMIFKNFAEYAGEMPESVREIVRSFGNDQKQAFDAVAPVAIYHFADIIHKDEAKKAFRLLRQALGDDHPLIDGASNVDEVVPEQLKDAYMHLFANLAEQALENANLDYRFEIDRWGGFNYVDSDGEMLLGSDDSDSFPWVVSAKALNEVVIRKVDMLAEKGFYY